MENEFEQFQSESLDELLSATRSTSAAPTGIPTSPHAGISCLSSLHRGDVLEIQGPSGSGKTHLLYHLICSCVLPLHFGGWNKVSVVFDTDGTFDIQRLQTLLRTRLSHSSPPDGNTTEQIISVALRNVHIFRPESSSQLAAGLANLSSYHMGNLPTSEIALLAIDSASSFHWLDRSAAERGSSVHPMTLAAPLSTPSNNFPKTIHPALWSFRRSHHPVIVILNCVPNPTSAPRNVSASDLNRQFLPSLSTSVNRTSSNSAHVARLPSTCQISLDLIRVVPSSHTAADKQWISSLTPQVDVHVHVNTALNHTELLRMRINHERVIITMTDVSHTSDSDNKEE